MIKKLYIRIICALGIAVDIQSHAKYPMNVLSNFWGNSFTFDGVQCKSMEGFLQSLKHNDVTKQNQVCQCRGKKAKHMGTNRWKTDQQLYWKGRTIDRNSNEYQKLLRDAYTALYTQNQEFRNALMLTRGKRLYHSIGSNNSYDTVLTSAELCSILTDLRDGTDKFRQCSAPCSRTNCPFRK